MNKKVLKIIGILFMAVMLVCIMNNIAVAKSGKSGSALVNGFKGSTTTEAESGRTIVQKLVSPVLNIIRIIATGVSIIMITFLGIKYMSAAPNEKANIKNQLVTFTIGAVVVIGATSLLDIAKEAITNIF